MLFVILVEVLQGPLTSKFISILLSASIIMRLLNIRENDTLHSPSAKEGLCKGGGGGGQ